MKFNVEQPKRLILLVIIPVVLTIIVIGYNILTAEKVVESGDNVQLVYNPRTNQYRVEIKGSDSDPKQINSQIDALLKANPDANNNLSYDIPSVTSGKDDVQRDLDERKVEEEVQRKIEQRRISEELLQGEAHKE